MAIPVINEVPKYKLTIPSMNKQVFFRPFLVKEQKILLMAMESQDEELIIKAIVDTIQTCLLGEVNANLLSTFDIEYIFTKIRAKSVGETAEVGIYCEDCGHINQVILNLDEIKVSEVIKPPEIKLTDKFILKLRYPSYSKMNRGIAQQKEATFSNLIFQLALASLDKLHTEDELINLDDETDEEKIKFLDNLNPKQFQDIISFVEDIPQLSHDIDFNCEKCNHHNHQLLKGIQSFFL